MRQIAHGAEAKLFLDEKGILKQRVEKSYRHPLIDCSLRRARTKREARIIEKLNAIGFPSPQLLDINLENMSIKMGYVKGQLLKNILENDHLRLSREIGEKIAILHDNNIIHGDLTTSNMVLDENTKSIYFIDFGLSFVSIKEEDKAVDLHLLRQALESKHYAIWEECYKEILEAYKKKSKNAEKVLQRLKKVEKRGRNKQK
ncbi:MAG: KEOPS complex kinase/ATPase Bud32 [Candidatus Woesearchaeota archaeon]|nr:KEOPS complex kinase/ATPase Bud32 [Candidatus Woesearchaeota archaeon]